MKFNVGDKIRRKNHAKQKNKKNNHEIVTIVKFYKMDKFDMVALRYPDGINSFMSAKGLDWYEKVINDN